MFLQPLDLTTALRPILYTDETLLFVQDTVGLYEGCVLLHTRSPSSVLKGLILDASRRKFKLPNHQHGHAYLTSHRVCYVDNAEPRKHSVAIELKHVERYEFYVLHSS